MIITNENKRFITVTSIFIAVIVKNQKLRELEKYCLEDPINNAFALWDLRVDKKNSEFYVDWKDKVRGYMLIYHGSDVPSIIIRGEENSVKRFIDMLSLERAVIHFPYKYCDLWKNRNEKYKIDVMAAIPKYYFFDDEVKLIRNPTSLSSLFTNPDYLVNKALTFGIYKENRVVSVASALVHLPEVWVLGAVLTKKEHRNKGLATRVVGHLMSYAYGKTDLVVLWVRSDNDSAIHIYKRFGFEKVEEDCWINVGVSILP